MLASPRPIGCEQHGGAPGGGGAKVPRRDFFLVVDVSPAAKLHDELHERRGDLEGLERLDRNVAVLVLRVLRIGALPDLARFFNCPLERRFVVAFRRGFEHCQGDGQILGVVVIMQRLEQVLPTLLPTY